MRKWSCAAAKWLHDARGARFLEALLHEPPSAGAPAPHFLRILHAQIEQRRGQRQFLVQQHLHRRIVQIDAVRRHINAGLDAVVQSFASVSVARHFQSLTMGFVDDRLCFFQRERWRVHHRAVRLEVKFLRAVNLDPVHAVVRLLADRVAHAVGSVGNLRAQIRNR